MTKQREQTMTETDIVLRKLEETDKNEFKLKIQEAFGIALAENFGDTAPVPSDKELDEAFEAPDNKTYCIISNNQKVGGAIVKIDRQNRHNFLEFFFIYAGRHGLGLGLAAWNAIEQEHPETLVWETVTPYFEKRNINFYVNKCGFHIVEFCNKHHRCNNEHYNQDPEDVTPGTEDFFRFEKVMKAPFRP